MGYLDLDIETERVKGVASEVLSSGGHYQPMIGIFEEGQFRAAIVIRPFDEDDRDDKACSFAEACTLIPFVRGDEVVVSFDSHMKRHDVGGIVEELDAISVMVATSTEADGHFLPYDTDEEGRFTQWIEDAKDTDDINPSVLSGNMIATLAHFMNFHAAPEYPEAMMKSLAKRGHIITLPDQRQFISPEAYDTIDPSEQMKKAIREG